MKSLLKISETVHSIVIDKCTLFLVEKRIWFYTIQLKIFDICCSNRASELILHLHFSNMLSHVEYLRSKSDFSNFWIFTENDSRTVYLLTWNNYFIIWWPKWLSSSSHVWYFVNILHDFHYDFVLSVDFEPCQEVKRENSSMGSRAGDM